MVDEVQSSHTCVVVVTGAGGGGVGVVVVRGVVVTGAGEGGRVVSSQSFHCSPFPPFPP